MDLSIIIPAYNAQDYIAACLRSVVVCPKDKINMECIVVNDGSSDDTKEIVHRYIERDSRIKLINKENGGVSDTRNYGLEYAVGTYIMFLDSDDRLSEDAWEYIVPAIQKNQSDYTAFSYYTLYENGKIVPQELPLDKDFSTEMSLARTLMYASSDFNACWGKLFRKNIIEENKICFQKGLPIGEDFLFVAEYFSYCKTYYMSKDKILYYLQRNGSAMRSYTMEQRLAFTKILYEYNKIAVQSYKDEELTREMNVYYLRVITNLFREFANIHKGKDLEESFKSALQNDIVIEILDKVEEQHIYSKMKKFEYKLLKNKRIGILRRYFSVKARL